MHCLCPMFCLSCMSRGRSWLGIWSLLTLGSTATESTRTTSLCCFSSPSERSRPQQSSICIHRKPYPVHHEQTPLIQFVRRTDPDSWVLGALPSCSSLGSERKCARRSRQPISMRTDESGMIFADSVKYSSLFLTGLQVCLRAG